MRVFLSHDRHPGGTNARPGSRATRSQRPDLAEHPENVFVLNSLHHRAFDANLFTVDSDYQIRASPSFDPGHPFLRQTIIERQGEQLSLPPDVRVRSTFLEELNAGLYWL
ncbi:HNH endonuclease [Halovivax limisalsi]|uniref:HNH endonuclease n=1 Tax=Halovivax limisalsi TaxID=1453760 RepID=UPI003CCCB5DB